MRNGIGALGGEGGRLLIAVFVVLGLVAGPLIGVELGRLRVESDPGVEVIWEGVSLGTTNAEGVMTIGNIPLGEYQLTLVKRGYLSRKADIVITEGEILLNLGLAAAEPVEATGDELPQPPPQPKVPETGQLLDPVAVEPRVPSQSPVDEPTNREAETPTAGGVEAGTDVDKETTGSGRVDSPGAVRNEGSSAALPDRSTPHGTVLQRQTPEGESSVVPDVEPVPAEADLEPVSMDTAGEDPFGDTSDVRSEAAQGPTRNGTPGRSPWLTLLVLAAVSCGLIVAYLRKRRRGDESADGPERLENPAGQTIEAVPRPSFLSELRQRESEMEKTIDR